MIVGYFLLPETESRTLEDIEIHFSDNKRKLTDRKIQKNASNNFKSADCDTLKNTIEINEKTPSVVNMISNGPNNISAGQKIGIYNKSFAEDV